MPKKTEGQVRDLDGKLDRIINRLDTIETVLANSQQNPELSSVLADFKGGVSLYSEPLKAIKRLYDARKFMKAGEAEKDEVSRLIIQSLALRGPLNISQIERELRAARGSASRRIIRSRLKKLEEKGVVKVAEGWGHRYRLVE